MYPKQTFHNSAVWKVWKDLSKEYGKGAIQLVGVTNEAKDDDEAKIKKFTKANGRGPTDAERQDPIPSDMNTSVTNQIIPILLALARNGSKSRPKAKMLLTDYAKIRKGEMTVDSLLSYSLS